MVIPGQLYCWLLMLALVFGTSHGMAQRVTLRPAPAVELPPVIDGNSAAFWSGERMTLFHSTGVPFVSSGLSQFELSSGAQVAFDSEHHPVWFEAAWRDDDGTLFLWYHHEPGGVCPGSSLSTPKIGAAVSYDGGITVVDLGIVLESGYPPVCSAKNGFFAGGHGDMSVVLDQHRNYFYFLFTNYGGPSSEQGVAIARMSFEDRFAPAGTVQKYHRSEWAQPGIGGRVSPMFPAQRAWENRDADSFWGPSIHWNRFLEQYVIFMNRACCEPNWPQEGIYVSFNPDISHPESWTLPNRVLSKKQIPWGPGYYPQVLGLEAGDTDSYAGEVARFYIHGRSIWEAVFSSTAPEAPEDPEPSPEIELGPLETVRKATMSPAPRLHPN